MSARKDRAEAATRAWVAALVRSGLSGEGSRRASVAQVVAHDLPWLPAEATAQAWVAAEDEAWRAEAAQWPRDTAYDRLQRAFAALGDRGVPVLQGVEDHWVAQALLDREAGAAGLRGVAWFTVADVWHAVDEPMLELNLWHADGANAAPGDPLLDEVLAVLAAAGLPARFDEGRVEIAVRWQKRPS